MPRITSLPNVAVLALLQAAALLGMATLIRAAAILLLAWLFGLSWRHRHLGVARDGEGGSGHGEQRPLDPFRARRPRSSKETGAPSTRSRTVSDTRISDVPASAATRACR